MKKFSMSLIGLALLTAGVTSYADFTVTVTNNISSAGSTGSKNLGVYAQFCPAPHQCVGDRYDRDTVQNGYTSQPYNVVAGYFHGGSDTFFILNKAGDEICEYTASSSFFQLSQKVTVSGAADNATCSWSNG